MTSRVKNQVCSRCNFKSGLSLQLSRLIKLFRFSIQIMTTPTLCWKIKWAKPSKVMLIRKRDNGKLEEDIPSLSWFLRQKMFCLQAFQWLLTRTLLTQKVGLQKFTAHCLILEDGPTLTSNKNFNELFLASKEIKKSALVSTLLS